MTYISKDEFNPLPLGTWKFNDFVGERIDIISKARLITKEAWNEIYPQTEEAFRLREDDKSHPGRGVWRGEFWGKYLLGVIAAYRYYNTDDLKNRIAEGVKQLISTQDPNGYIGTYTKSDFHIGDTWNTWGRKYTLWALIEAFEILKDNSIIEAASKFTDHIISELGPNGVDIVKTGNFYGMPSTSILGPIVKLYKITEKKEYLEFAKYIVEQWRKQPDGMPNILNNGLANKPVHTWAPNPFIWAKGYEFMSCVEGLLDLYSVTGCCDYFIAGKNIYNNLLECERTEVGSLSFNDKLIGSRYIINTVSEICDAVYWNRLSYSLLLLTGETKYIDEIELTLYNSLLCGSGLDGKWGLRRLRTSHEHIPAHRHFLDGHQCCVDNLPRGLFQAVETAVFVKQNHIYIGLYNKGCGSIEVSGNVVFLEVDGDIIEDGKIKIKLNMQESRAFTISLRIPSWSKNSVISVNKENEKRATKAGWFKIDRIWKGGDVINLNLNSDVRVRFFDNQRFTSEDDIISFHVKEWAAMGTISEDRTMTKQVTHVTEGNALPHARAAMFFKGPMALSRDIRLGDYNIFEELEDNIVSDNVGKIKSIEAPMGIYKAYELELRNSKKIRLCDFASAGNTWTMDSKFNTWQILMKKDEKLIE